MDLSKYTGEGFFDLGEKEKIQYENAIFNVCFQILKEMETEHPNEPVGLSLIENIKDLEKHFKFEEDYEMAYLMNSTIKRLEQHI